MDFYSELLAQLRNGVKAEDLAAQMSKDLERAEKEHNEAMAAKRAAQEKEEKKAAARKKFRTDYGNALREYLNAIGIDASIFTDTKTFDKDIEEALELIETMATLIKPENKCSCGHKKEESDEEVLAKFLKSLSDLF